MTIPAPRRILVGLEDMATAGVVATAAAHLAMDQDATTVILLHVIDISHRGLIVAIRRLWRTSLSSARVVAPILG